MVAVQMKSLGMTMLIIAFPALLSCSRGQSQDRYGEVMFMDLLEKIGSARISDSGSGSKYQGLYSCERVYRCPWGSRSPRVVKIGFEMNAVEKLQVMKRSLHMAAREGSPCSIAFPLRMRTPDRLFLSLDAALLAGGRDDDSLRFTVELAGRDGERTVLYDSLRDEPLPEMRWRPIRVEFPETGYEDAELRLVFSSDSEAVRHLLVGQPKIFARGDPGEEPNLLFIIVDAMRADAVQCVKPGYGVTPRMDALAGDGYAFTHHFVSSNWTRPSTINMLTGCYASVTGVNLFWATFYDENRDYFYRESGIRPLSTILKSRGFVTRFIGNNPFMMEYTGIGIDLDFDDFSNYDTKVKDTMYMTREAISWLRKNGKKRFFLMMNYNAPHNSYNPPKEYHDRLKKRFPGMDPMFRAYLGEVAYTDDFAGRVIEELKKLGLYDKTVIVITSDHGEVFKSAHSMSPYTDVGSIYTHGQTQYDEELHTPLIIKPAGDRGAGKRIDRQVRSIDIMPTLLDMLGVGKPGNIQGKTMMPVIEGTEREDRVLYSEGRMMYSVRTGGYKYAERFYGFGIRPQHWGGDHVEEFRELYDLREDPEEENNILDERPDIARKMKALLKRERFKQPDNIIESAEPAGGTLHMPEGFFYDLRIEGEGSRAVRVNRRRYDFSLRPGGRLLFQTIPANGKVLLNLDRGGSLYCGPFMLSLADRTRSGEYVLDPGDPTMTGWPVLDAAFRKGVLFWSVPRKSGIRSVKKEKYLTRQINELLRSWGYIQGKEKKKGKDEGPGSELKRKPKE